MSHFEPGHWNEEEDEMWWYDQKKNYRARGKFLEGRMKCNICGTEDLNALHPDCLRTRRQNEYYAKLLGMVDFDQLCTYCLELDVLECAEQDGLELDPFITRTPDPRYPHVTGYVP